MIDYDREVLDAIRMPVCDSVYADGRRGYDIDAIKAFTDGEPCSSEVPIVYERVNAHACGHIMTAFSFGMEIGRLLEALKDHPSQFLTPPHWMRILGLKKKFKGHKASLDYCRTVLKLSIETLIGSKRGHIPHDGICDAICIGLASLPQPEEE